MRKATGFCLQCEIESNTLFCSTRCRRRNERGRIEAARFCFHCGESIGPERSSLAQFCNESCRVAYRQANDSDWRDSRVQYARNQRAKRKLADGNFTRQEWLDLLDFYEGVCLACGSSEAVSADHVVPLAVGGSNTIDNIQPLCKPCNSKKHTKTIDYRALAL